MGAGTFDWIIRTAALAVMAATLPMSVCAGEAPSFNVSPQYTSSTRLAESENGPVALNIDNANRHFCQE